MPARPFERVRRLALLEAAEHKDAGACHRHRVQLVLPRMLRRATVERNGGVLASQGISPSSGVEVSRYWITL